VETDETGKSREKPQAVSGKGKGYAALVCGLLTWGVIALAVIGPIVALSKLWPLGSIIFSVLGIAIGRHALKTNERLAAWIGIILSVGFYACFIVVIIATS